MDNFNDGANTNLLGGSEGTAGAGSGSISFVSTGTLGNTGSSRKFAWDAASGDVNYFSGRNSANLSSFRYVSFWIRGENGGESLNCMMDDGTNFPQARVVNFIPDQITKDWQKVVISTAAFYNLIGWGPVGGSGAFNLLAGNSIASSTGSIYVDDIRFGTRPSPIMWDNFNDGAAPFNYGLDYGTFIDPAGASITPSYDSTLFYGTTGYSYKIDFTSSAATTNAVILIQSTNTGIDLTGTDTLSFRLRGDALAAGNNLAISLKDTAAAEVAVALTAQTGFGGGIPSTFQEVRVPLSNFSGTVDITKVLNMGLWLQKAASPAITPGASTYILHLDNIQFIDTSTPTTPTSFLSGGTAIANGSVINSTGVLTVTADPGATDITLEEVRFEHDGLTGGASWYTIAVDTDLADGTYGTTWYTQSLSRGTSYQIRALALDVQGNYSFAGPFTVEITSSTPNAPGVSGFQMFQTSATVSLALNGNPVGTTLSVSTGAFETSASSSGKVTSFTLNGLVPNTTYTLSAVAVSGAFTSSATVVASTATFVFAPGGNSFAAVQVSSITVSWTNNGNPLTPPTSYQLQVSTDVNFGVYTDSKTFATSASTAGLAGNTSYYFRVSAFGVIGGTGAFNSTIATYTLSAAPSFAAFISTQVGISSVTVRWSANGNAAQTPYELDVTTDSNFGVYQTSATFNLEASTAGLSPNTTHYFRARAQNQNGLYSAYASNLSTITLAASPGYIAYQLYATSAGIIVSANGNPSGTQYRLLISTDGFSTVAFSSQGASAGLVASGLQANSTYQVGLDAVNFNNVPSSRTLVDGSTATSPNVPGASSFIGVSGTSITVTWGANGNPLTPPTSYWVQMSTDSNFGVYTDSKTYLLQASTSGLSLNATYYFRVAAFGRIGSTSAFNAAISTVTGPNAPGVVEFAVETTSISVTLSANGNPAGVTLTVSTGSFEASSSSSAVFGAGNVTLLLQNLTANTTYQVRAVASGAAQSTITVVTASTATLAQVPGTNSFVGVSGTSITVTWATNGNPLTPPTSYQLQVSTDSNFGVYTDSKTYLVQASTAGLSPNSTYYFRTAAFNRYGSTTAFNAAISTVTGPVAPGLSGFQVFTTSVTAFLTNNGNPAGSQIALTTGSYEASASSYGITEAGVTTLTVNGLTPNSNYGIFARVIGITPSSNTVVSASTPTLPMAPGANSFSAVQASSITVSWTSNGNPLTPPTSYQLQISTDIGFGVFTGSATFLTSASTTGLLGNTSYYFRTVTFGIDGTSNTFNSAIATYTLAAVPSFTAFISTQVGISSVTIRWSAGGNAAGTPYELNVTTDGNFGIYQTSATFALEASSAGLSPNATHFFRVRAQNQNGLYSDYTSSLSTVTLAISPGFSAFQMYTTSAAITVAANGNPTGTPFRLLVSTDGFSTIAFSSQGASAGLVVSGLQANSTYQVGLDAVNFNNVPSSRTLVDGSTATLVNVPGASSFIGISGTSITVTWGANGNSLTPPTSYWVHISTDSNFGVYTDSKTFLLQASTSGLTLNSTYYFRVAAFGRLGSTTSFNAAISTVTGPNAPGVVEFTVYTTSISAVLSGNGNSAATVLTLSTGSFEASASSSGLLGAGNATLVLSNLTANTTYQVRAVASGATQSTITVVTASTATLAQVPGTNSFVGVTGTSVTVTWATNGNPLTPPTSYQLLVSTDSGFGVYTDSKTFLVSASTAGLSPNTTYYFRTAAFSRTGSTTAFNASISTVTGPNAPGLSGFQVSTNSITVTLSANGNPVGTTFVISTGSFEASSSSAGALPGASVSLVLSNLTANRSYTVQARAVNFIGSPSSATAVASTATLPATPGAISFGSVSNNSITVSWGNNGNALTPQTSYQLQVSSNDPTFASFTSGTTFGLTLTTSSLAAVTTYYFRVYAFGVGGSTSVFSGPVSTVTAATPLTAPSTPTAFSVTQVSTGHVTFSWTDNANNENGFYILNSTNGIYGSASADAASLSVGNLSANVLVSARIAAFNAIGASTSSLTISSYTLARAPASLSFLTVNSNNVSIGWSANGNSTSTLYEVSRSTDNFVFGPAISTAVAFTDALTSTSTTISGLSAGGTYYFRVRARNGDAVVTAFASAITTVTTPSVAVISTGGAVSAGGTTVTADPGVSITNTFLSNGTTEQVLVSTQTATATYGSGFTLTLTAGVEARVVATADTMQLTSTQSVTVVQSGLTLETSSGTVNMLTTADTLTVNVATDAVQNIRTNVPHQYGKTYIVTLNPASGEIKTRISTGTFNQGCNLRLKMPDGFPAARSPGFVAAAPSAFSGLGLGLEVISDVQPVKPVPITITFRDSDIANLDRQRLVIARFEDSTQSWLAIPTTFDFGDRRATAQTLHFSKFQLMSLTPATDVDQARVYPNPLQTHKGQTVMNLINLTAFAKVRIYTYAGELVRELDADAIGTARWDAKNIYGEPVASGIYITHIQGDAKSEKILKLVVEK